MTYTVYVVMDPIEKIKIVKDSTFAMMLEAQRRGAQLRYIKPGHLHIAQGQASCTAAPVQVWDNTDRWFELGEFTNHVFDGHDVVLMRTDPPVDPNYLQDTIVLSMAQQQGALGVRADQALGQHQVGQVGFADLGEDLVVGHGVWLLGYQRVSLRCRWSHCAETAQFS